MALSEQERLKRRHEHEWFNERRASIGKRLIKVPDELLTTEEIELRRKAELERLDRNRKARQRRYHADIATRGALGILLPYEKMSWLINVAGENKVVFQTTKDQIFEYERIDPNRKQNGVRSAFNVMMIDIDSDLSVEEFEEATGIRPHFFVGKRLPNGKLQRPHAIIELAYPVKCSPETPSQRRQLAYFESIADRTTEALLLRGHDADFGQKTTMKNPDYGGWDVDVSREIPMRLDTIDKQVRPALKAAREAAKHTFRFPEAFHKLDTAKPLRTQAPKNLLNLESYPGRNSALFDMVRQEMRDTLDAGLSYDVYYERSRDLLSHYNAQLAFPLPTAEINGIARSHAKWFANSWHGRKPTDQKLKNRGAARHLILPWMTEKERQAVGAAYSHDVQSKRTWQQVREAKRQHPNATKAQVAKTLKRDVKTVAKYWDVPTDGERAAARKIAELSSNVAFYMSSIVEERLSEASSLRESGAISKHDPLLAPQTAPHSPPFSKEPEPVSKSKNDVRWRKNQLASLLDEIKKRKPIPKRAPTAPMHDQADGLMPTHAESHSSSKEIDFLAIFA